MRGEPQKRKESRVSPKQAELDEHRQAKNRWWRVLLIFVIWLSGLAALSIYTADPVTLNRKQILESTDVLSVVVEDWSKGRMKVTKSWKNDVEDERVTIGQLPEQPQPAGTKWLIPVVRNRGQLFVTVASVGNGLSLIYPDIPVAERQLQSILETGQLP